jgi:NAD(P)-dependent dehydrogenase (short-subunit alcohol dehydrogenase family)
MVANAGIGLLTSLEEMSLADWRRQQAINLDGVFLSVKHAIPAMRRAGGSASLAGYCATKGGVRLLAKAAALEVASDNIRVNSSRRRGKRCSYCHGAFDQGGSAMSTLSNTGCC